MKKKREEKQSFGTGIIIKASGERRIDKTYIYTQTHEREIQEHKHSETTASTSGLVLQNKTLEPFKASWPLVVRTGQLNL